MSKLPAFQFYPGDWMKDPALRSVSHAARGFWMDALCLMFESPRRGYLQQANGGPLSLQQIGRMTGCSGKEAALLLQELEDAGVCSHTETRVIYSRRMVRDEEKRFEDRTRQQDYRVSTGKTKNPTKRTTKDSGDVTQDVTPMSHDSSSSTSSSPAKQERPPVHTARTNSSGAPPGGGCSDEQVTAIACAHPLAATRGLTGAQVSQGVCAAIVGVLAAGEDPVQLLAKVSAIRDVVLREWPVHERKFLKGPERFFLEYEFNRPLEEWSYAKRENHCREKQPAAVERQRITHDAIRAAGARRYGIVAADHDGAGTGLLPAAGAA